MKCPVDGADLLMTSREGVEIDYCPQCRGIWLDRGELDKLIERSLSVEQSARNALNDSAAPKAKRDAYYEDDADIPHRPLRTTPRQSNDYDDERHKKPKGFLGEIFDIFD